MRNPLYEITLNQVFNHLTVISLKTKINEYSYRCRCVCGKICWAKAGDLYNNKKKSCGCKMGTPYLGKNVRIINALYAKYKLDAKIRKFKWRLSIEDFKLLINGNCFYCGEESSNRRIVQHSLNGVDILLYNGIDRINSKKGYTFTNSVSCCAVCNSFKNNRPMENFLAHVKKIHDYLNLGFPLFASVLSKETITKWQN